MAREFAGIAPLTVARMSGAPHAFMPLALRLGRAVTSGVHPLIEANQLRALAVSSVQRSPSVLVIPTVLELGFPNSEYVFWIGAFAPAATPRDVVARLHDAITKALADPEVANAIRKLGAEPLTLTPEKFGEFIMREIESNAALVKAAGIPRN